MSIFGSLRRSKAPALLQELAPLSHPARVLRMIELGRAAQHDKKTAELLDELWNTDDDSRAYGRRLVLKSCYGSRDGARVVKALSDASRLVRFGAIKLVALCCSDEQALSALKTTWYVRQHLRLLPALRKRDRTVPVDAFLDWLAGQPGDTRLAECVPFGSEAAILRHLPAAILRPSYLFWSGLLSHAPALLSRHLTSELRKGAGKPDSQLLWVIERSLPQLAVRVPALACELCDALLDRGVQPAGAIWPLLIRHEPQGASEVAARHPVQLPAGAFEKSARYLGTTRLAALLRRDCWSLGDPKVWFRFLPADERRVVLSAWLDTIRQHPSWGAALLRELDRDPELGRPEVVADAYSRWSPAAQSAEGIIALDLLKRLPGELAEREARRHLSSVTALQTRPHDRLPYASHLGWEEASAVLKTYIGHPEGETRGHALSVLLALAGWTSQLERRPGLVEEALRMAKARKNEQDPVRLAMLTTLAAWPREAWQARNLADVGQLLRDALDAADLSHTTAKAAEALVVRLLRLDGSWGGRWLATLIKERGTIYAPRLGDQLTDDEVRAVAPMLLEVARSWAVREREGHLVQLAASLQSRLGLVPGLLEIIERVVRDTATAGTALQLMIMLGKHERARFDALIGEVCKIWLKRSWDGPLVSLTQSLERGQVPAPLVSALEEALGRCIYAAQAGAILSVLARRAAGDFQRIVPAAIERDVSIICLPVVHEFLHRKRQDLLEPCLGKTVITGRFATGKTRWLLPFSDGFFRWTPRQQELYAAQLTQITDDPERDTPTIFWAIVRMPRLQFMVPQALIRLADDKRPAVLEKATRTLGRCDAGQGVEKLLVCLEDSRARYAIYSLRRAVLELPPEPALALLKKVPMHKVTVAKEVVRLLGELRSEPAFAALLALDGPTLHRDVRIALIRALWDHLERPETWQFLRGAATGSDWILASRVGDIPPDRMTAEVDRKLSETLALVLGRPEPEARLELLRRAASLPIKDRERTFLAACLARIDSRFADEVTAALHAALARAAETDLPSVRQALVAARSNRRAAALVSQLLLGLLPARTAMIRHVAEALVAALADDAQAVPLYLSCALRVYAEPLQIDRWVEILGRAARRDELDGPSLTAAQAATRLLPVARVPIAELEELERRLHKRAEPELRLIALEVLTAVASHGQGWTPERRARLAAFADDAAALVAGAAAFTFPPAEEAPGPATSK